MLHRTGFALACLLVSGIAISSGTLNAQESAAAVATESGAHADGPRAEWSRGGHHRGAHSGHRGERREARASDPVHAARSQLRQLEHLYLVSGRAKDIPALYEDLLTRTQNPALRRFAYERIARVKQRPADPAGAIAALRAGLDESLKQLQ